MTLEQFYDQWKPARLISASGIRSTDEQEVRATAALLAVMAAVPEFGRTLASALGAPAGRLLAFTEVVFKTPTGTTLRPDGALVVQRGSTTWVALIEVKTGVNELRREQVEAYLDVARELGFDCVLTISNQIAGNSSAPPVEVDRRKTKRVQLVHRSWLEILTEAAFQHEHRGISDPDQAYILSELIHYLEDHRSGAMKFEDMGTHWVTVRDGARNGTLRGNDPAVHDVVGRWDQLLKYLALDLGRDLGAPVREILSRKERADPASRRSVLVEQLAQNGTLSGVLRIPGAIGDVQLSASLRAKMLSASITFDAPEFSRSVTAIRWLLRQLESAPDSLRVDVNFAGSRQGASALLKDARQDESKLLVSGLRPRQFVLTLNGTMGERRDNKRGSFIDSVAQLLHTFYAETVQSLREVQRSAPRLKTPEYEPGSVTESVLGAEGPPPDLALDPPTALALASAIEAPGDSTNPSDVAILGAEPAAQESGTPVSVSLVDAEGHPDVDAVRSGY